MSSARGRSLPGRRDVIVVTHTRLALAGAWRLGFRSLAPAKLAPFDKRCIFERHSGCLPKEEAALVGEG
ncbi:hypothetical protein ZHAS_00011417 [Anopheles sinensis]|uniref:Uncharacterized protein n=1 Tax=Anopheles sinensis TaxID=74873 RepID=A0A084W0E3_ANOSI|nr:hypothetical protein ZHAS_00011417 [Anopheles sinensis]